mgnify:CR=1 FL=1
MIRSRFLVLAVLLVLALSATPTFAKRNYYKLIISNGNSHPIKSLQVEYRFVRDTEGTFRETFTYAYGLKPGSWEKIKLRNAPESIVAKVSYFYKVTEAEKGMLNSLEKFRKYRKSIKYKKVTEQVTLPYPETYDWILNKEKTTQPEVINPNR